jgi:hypothetical protein
MQHEKSAIEVAVVAGGLLRKANDAVAVEHCCPEAGPAAAPRSTSDQDRAPCEMRDRANVHIGNSVPISHAERLGIGEQMRDAPEASACLRLAAGIDKRHASRSTGEGQLNANSLPKM